VGAANDAGRLQLVKLGVSLLKADGVQPPGFCKDRRPSGLDVVSNAVMRRVSFKVSGKNCGIFG